MHTLNDQIASAKALLNSYHISCECKRQESENLNNDISRLEVVISRFKNNNEEYLKIKKTIEEEVNEFLIDGKALLQFALASVIEALRRNPDKYNNILMFNTSSSSATTPTLDSLLPLSLIENYKEMMLDEAKKLYDILLHHFTNSIMDNAASAASSSSPSFSTNTSSLPADYSLFILFNDSLTGSIM